MKAHASPMRPASTIFIFLCVAVWLFPIATHAQVGREVLKDGVERWYIQEAARGDAYLTRKFAEIYNVVFTSQSARPFGKSIAFLVGVSKYSHLSQLPSVRNDVSDMRSFLLDKAGFDEVYVATDEIVNRDLIEQYVKGVLPAKMQKDDRLLFYYSGHGGDNQGQTGYMLFSGAQRSQFYGPDVLAVDSLNDWSRELQIKHALFILDSCSSGLGIVEKSGTTDSNALLLKTLSGNGSRTVLTAGTADEETYAEENRQQAGHSIFTKSLLDAFDSRSLSDSGGLITIDELFADSQKEMAQFRATSGRSTTPRMWPLQEFDYRGTFVFLNPRTTTARLTAEQAKALQVVPKAENSDATDSASGIIEVFSARLGELYVDGRPTGLALAGQTQDFENLRAGLHSLEFRSSEGTETQQATVRNGTIIHFAFGQKSPIDQSGSVPVGALILRSTHGLRGEVFLDNFSVGRLELNGELSVSDITVGHHEYRIVGATQIESGHIEVSPNETVRISVVPNPPTNLKIAIQ